MFRKLLITGFAFLSALPALANTTKLDASKAATAQDKPVALRLMSDSQFATFLERLDADLLRSGLHLKKMDLKSLNSDVQARQELQRSYTQCWSRSITPAMKSRSFRRSKRSSLTCSYSIDLNELARNLDALDEALVNPASSQWSERRPEIPGLRERSPDHGWRAGRTDFHLSTSLHRVYRHR